MDVQIFDHDGRDNSILYKFAHSDRQKAIVAAGFSRFERARIFEASFSTLSIDKRPSVGCSAGWRCRSSCVASLVSCACNELTTCSTAKKLAEALHFSMRVWQIARKYEVALAERVRDEMAAKVTW